MPHPITITLPLPPKELHPNGGKRHNVYKLNRLAKACKSSAWAHTLEAVGRRTLGWTSATLDYTFHMPNVAAARLSDDDNAVAWMKSYRDGIAEALGINDKHFRTGKVAFKLAEGLPCVVVTLTPAEERR